jgi:predicted MFS family arabinose efflux permease
VPLSPRFPLTERFLLILLAAVQFTHIVDFMIMMPLGPQLMRELGISAAEFSVLIASYTVSAGVVGFLAAPFIDRFDRRTVLLVMYLGFGAGTYGCAVADSYGELLAARALCGAFGGVSSATILAIVGDLVPAERRGEAMGIVMTAFSAAAALGVPLGLVLAQRFRWETPFLVLALGAIGVEILLILFLPHVRGHLGSLAHGLWKNFVTLLRDANAWRAWLLMVALVFGHFTVIPFLSPHLVFNLKLPEGRLAAVYVLGGLLTVVTSPWIGRLSDRHGRVEVFTVLILAACVVMGLLTAAGPLPVAATLVLTGAFFVFASGRYVPAQAVLASAVPAVRRGAFLSLTSCTRDLCTGLVALLAGRIVVRSGESLHHVEWLGVIAVTCSLLSLWVIRQVRVAAEMAR